MDLHTWRIRQQQRFRRWRQQRAVPVGPGERHQLCELGVQRWTRHGKLHRDGDLPALISPAGRQEWFQHGQRHRENGPAFLHPLGAQGWYQQGVLHREDGPAQIEPDGSELWFRHGRCHRSDGPAVTTRAGRKEWWCEDELLRVCEPGRDIWYDGAGQPIDPALIEQRARSWQLACAESEQQRARQTPPRTLGALLRGSR